MISRRDFLQTTIGAAIMGSSAFQQAWAQSGLPIEQVKVLYGFPPGYGATGTAALLNVPDSLMALLRAMVEKGYTLGSLPAGGEELITRVKEADEAWVGRLPEGERFEDWQGASVTADSLRQWLGPLHTSRIEQQWGPLTDTGIRTLAGRFLLGGVTLGNVWIGVQPPLGVAGDLCDLPGRQVGVDVLGELDTLLAEPVDLLGDVHRRIVLHEAQFLDLLLEFGDRLLEIEEVGIH